MGLSFLRKLYYFTVLKDIASDNFNMYYDSSKGIIRQINNEDKDTVSYCASPVILARKQRREFQNRNTCGNLLIK